MINALHLIPRNDEGWFQIYQKYWKDDPDEKNFVIFENDLSVGWLKLNGLENKKIGWISMLAILPERQGVGIGRNAVRFAEEFFRSRDFLQCGIQTTEDNQKAIALYTGCGYKIIDQKVSEREDKSIGKFFVFQKNL